MISRATKCKSFSLPCRPRGHFVQSPNEVLGGEACHCLVLEAQASGFQTFIVFIYYYQSSSRVGCFLECSIYGTFSLFVAFLAASTLAQDPSSEKSEVQSAVARLLPRLHAPVLHSLPAYLSRTRCRRAQHRVQTVLLRPHWPQPQRISPNMTALPANDTEGQTDGPTYRAAYQRTSIPGG